MSLIPYSQEFLEKADEYKRRLENEAQEWNKKMNEISNKEVPNIAKSSFGDAKKKEKIRWNDLEFVEGWWMEKQMDELFPGWSNDAPPGSIHPHAPIITAHARLLVPEKILMYYGIFPPYRIFSSTIHELVKVSKESNIMDYKNWVSLAHDSTSAGTKALKVCINRLCHIGDEVYRRMDMTKLSESQEKLLSELTQKYPFMERYIVADLKNEVVNRENFNQYFKTRETQAIKLMKQQQEGKGE